MHGRNLLVVAEVAFSWMLLTGPTIFFQGFGHTLLG